MGLFRDLATFGVGNPEGAFGIPSLGDTIKGFTGQAGAEAALTAAELQAAEARAAREQFAPIIEAGIAQIPELARGATVGGFGENIGAILEGGALDPLIAQRQRAATAQLASTGLRRSGAATQAAADIPADLALQIEGELNRRRQSIAGQGQTGAGESSRLSSQIGQALAGGQLGAAQAQAQGSQNTAGVIGTLFSAFSDMRLKTNVEVVGDIEGVEVIAWDWNETAFIKYGFEGSSTGFNSNKIKESHPQHVYETEDGMLKIDYEGLLGELKNGSH